MLGAAACLVILILRLIRPMAFLQQKLDDIKAMVKNPLDPTHRW